MSIWIITTGNSDVQLKTDENWEEPFYEQVRYDENKDIKQCDKFAAIKFNKATELYPVPARVMGIAAENQLQEYYDDFAFPLLDTFSQYFSKHPDYKPSIIVVILTNQRNIFVNEDGELNEKTSNKTSPFWQDTCTLEPVFKEYFTRSQIFSTIEPKFFTLTPKSEQGLHNWNETLTVVEELLGNIKNELYTYPQYDQNQTVYVSHQAGTAAISSAVQFASLSQFKNVKFLSSNIFYNDDGEQISEPQIINISNYWMGIQIQKAKQSVIDGLPGVALSLLQEIDYVDKKDVIPRLEHMVSVFNIRESLTEGHEFEVESAIQRVVEALDLVEIFFKEKNYLQGIALLAAAHETFLKAAISNEIENKQVTLIVNGTKKIFKSTELVRWQQPGLVFIRNNQDKYIDKKLKFILDIPDWDRDDQKLINLKIDILKQLSFPVHDYEYKFRNKKLKFDIMNGNSALFKWLCKLRPEFQYWSLLKWMCIEKDKYKEYNDDIRNGLMHNLLGFNENEVIQYLCGNSTASTYSDVLTAYQQAVKEKFLDEINCLGLSYERNLYDELNKIANDIT